MHTRDFLLGIQPGADFSHQNMGCAARSLTHSNRWLGSYVRSIVSSSLESLSGYENSSAHHYCLGLIANFMVHVLPSDRTCYCFGLGAEAIAAAAIQTYNKSIVFDLSGVNGARMARLFSVLAKVYESSPFMNHSFSRLPLTVQIDRASHTAAGAFIFADVDRQRQDVLSCFAKYRQLWPAGLEICLCGSAAAVDSITQQVTGVAQFKSAARQEFKFGTQASFCFALLS